MRGERRKSASVNDGVLEAKHVNTQ